MFARKHIGLILWLVVLAMPVTAVAEELFHAAADLAGYVSRYDEGVFERVIRVRIANGYGFVPDDWKSYDGYLAVLDCSTVGDEVWARPGPGHKWERFLIADCSGHASTTYWFNMNGIVAEVDHATFQRWTEAGYKTERGLTIEIRPPGRFYQWLG
jgi:hypothetical protein